MIARDGGRDASPTEETKGGRPGSHVSIRAERSTLRQSHAPAEPERNHCNYRKEVKAGARAARVVERTGKRDSAAEKHFRSNLSRRTSWYAVGHVVLYEVNTVLLQHATNLLGLLRVYASNTNTALDLAVTVLNDLDLERDAVQTKNDFPAQ